MVVPGSGKQKAVLYQSLNTLGKDNLYNFDLYPFKRLELKVKHHITEKDLSDNFNRIMNEVKGL